MFSCSRRCRGARTRGMAARISSATFRSCSRKTLQAEQCSACSIAASSSRSLTLSGAAGRSRRRTSPQSIVTFSCPLLSRRECWLALPLGRSKGAAEQSESTCKPIHPYKVCARLSFAERCSAGDAGWQSRCHRTEQGLQEKVSGGSRVITWEADRNRRRASTLASGASRDGRK